MADATPPTPSPASPDNDPPRRQKDHVDNLHLLAPVLTRWVLDRWR